MELNVAVVIPWRSHPSREIAFNRLVEYFSENHPTFKIFISDSDYKKFNLSAARNAGARKAISAGADIIIFNDADVFVTPDSIKLGAQVAASRNEIVAPYTEYFEHKTERETRGFLKRFKFGMRLGRKLVPPKISRLDGLPERLWPCSGSIIVPTNIFLELGGFNEEVQGWGPEDTIFHRAYFEKYNKLFTYVDGIAHSTHNDPTYRGDKEINQKFKDLSLFKDKRT